jgi:hypothetical protein
MRQEMIDEDTKKHVGEEKESLEKERKAILAQREKPESQKDLFLLRQLDKRGQAIADRIAQLDAALAIPADPEEPRDLEQTVQRLLGEALGPLEKQIKYQKEALEAVARKVGVRDLKAFLKDEEPNQG